MVYVDFHSVEPGHADIDARLRNWALWLFGSSRARSHAMWAWCKPAQHWEAVDLRGAVDPMDALVIEKAVCKLPPQHRGAVRWCYVYRGNPRRVAKSLSVTLDGLSALVHEARAMLALAQKTNNTAQKVVLESLVTAMHKHKGSPSSAEGAAPQAARGSSHGGPFCIQPPY